MKLNTNKCFDPMFFACRVRTNSSIQTVMVGDTDSLVTEMGTPFDELFGMRCTAKK